MKINFHNKIEINVGDRHYVCYNQMLDSVYSKITNLEPYFLYFALGSGTSQLNSSATKLGSYVVSLPCTLDAIQNRPGEGNYYIRKTASIASNDSFPYSFSEIGIAASSESNPDIYNHIVLKDDNNNPVTVTKAVGESLEIKMTVYLEITSFTGGNLTLGNNPLIRSILGEGATVKKIYAVRANNLSAASSLIYRIEPRNKTRYEANISGEVVSGNYELTISASLGTGSTKEILFVIDDAVFARTVTSSSASTVTSTEGYSSNSRKIICLSDKAIGVNSVTNTSTNVVDNNPLVSEYYSSVGDELNYEIDLSELSSDKVISADGKTLALVSTNDISFYSSTVAGFSKVQSGLIDKSNYIGLAMDDGAIFVFKSVSPYIEMYKIVNNTCIRQQLYMSNYDSSVYSYDFELYDVVKGGNDYLVGLVVGTNKIGLVLRFVATQDGYNLYSIIQSDLVKIKKMLRVRKSNYASASSFVFVTDEYDFIGSVYAMQRIGQTKETIGNYSEARAYMLEAGVSTHGDYFMIKYDSSPYIRAYDSYGDIDRFDISQITFESNSVQASYNFQYLIENTNDGVILYDINDIDMPSVIDLSFVCEENEEIEDVIVLAYHFIVVTDDNVYVYEKGGPKTKIENVDGALSSYSVDADYLEYIGTDLNEGVRGKIKLVFGESNNGVWAKNS